jgi:hypothetical protein
MLIGVALLLTGRVEAQPKPVPLLQVIPLPHDQVTFERDGVEMTRAHFAKDQMRPFLFPVIGPSGKNLTRMSHPHDPEGHSHHNSVWISHKDVGGVDFWGDHGKNQGRIVHQRIEKLTDGDSSASLTTLNHWLDDASKKLLMVERRRITVQLLPNNEWLMLIDSQFEGPADITLGKTSFGFCAVRMAKTIGMRDGGGTMRNSEGGLNEKGIFWKPAKWVDASGPTSRDPKFPPEGITLFDHPQNPNHPSPYHVRDDGWMGSSTTLAGPLELPRGKSVRTRYGVYVHAGEPAAASLDARWAEFAKTKLDDMAPAKK